MVAHLQIKAAHRETGSRDLNTDGWDDDKTILNNDDFFFCTCVTSASCFFFACSFSQTRVGGKGARKRASRRVFGTTVKFRASGLDLSLGSELGLLLELDLLIDLCTARGFVLAKQRSGTSARLWGSLRSNPDLLRGFERHRWASQRPWQPEPPPPPSRSSWRQRRCWRAR